MADSWWLKIKRAQRHMAEIKRASRAYANSRPYDFSRVPRPDSAGDVQYAVRITRQPDPMLAVLLGDFVHNLRSALDHIVVASVPRRRRNSASFPILFEDIWATDASGDLLPQHAERRENFETAISGIEPGARAVIVRVQPYRLGAEASQSIIGAISRLENADKHRQLIAVGGGVQHLIADVTVRGRRGRRPHRELADDQFAKDDTVVGWQLPPQWAEVVPPIRPSEVLMEYNGTAVVVIKIASVGENPSELSFPLHRTMLAALQAVRATLRMLEPYVLR